MFSHFLRKVLPFAWSGPKAALEVIQSGGMNWHLLPEAHDVLGPDGPDLNRWIADGRAELIKHGPHRSVYRVHLAGGVVYAKHCRVSNLRAWAREILRPAKSKLEFENALALRARGIAAIDPFGWGGRRGGWPGESVLLTRGRDSAIPFLHFLEQVLPALPLAEQPATRRQVARELGRFMARMHDCGVAHPDPHPGNLLVEMLPCRLPRFALIDLHAIRFGPPLRWAESRDNLVLYNRWFQLRASRADRLLFWHSYIQERGTLDLPLDDVGAAAAKEVESGTQRSNLHFWAGRESRCLGNNRYFRKVKSGPLLGHAVRDLDGNWLEALLAGPDALFTKPEAKLLKDSRTSTVAELTMPTSAGPKAVIFKRFRVRRWWAPFKNLFRPSAALRSWIVGQAFRDRRLPTPRPLAVFQRMSFGIPHEGYLLTEKVDDALDLPAAVLGLIGMDREQRARIVDAWAERIAWLIRTLHDRGGSHRDLKASNLMLEGGRSDPASATPVSIDLVGAGTGKPIREAKRIKELTRLNASFLQSPAIANRDRLRFLKLYLRAGLRGPDGWKSWWWAIRSATAAKVNKNRRSGRPLA